MKHLLTLSGCTVLGLVLVGGNVASVHGAEKDDAASAPAADNIRFFNEKVRPVLTQNCYKCHTTEAMGGLHLDSQAGVLKGGESGPAIVPKDPEHSLLIQAVRQTGDLKMPPEGAKLRESEISDLVEWVKRGGVWDGAESTKPIVATLTAAQAKGAPGDEFFENKVRPILATQCGTCHQDRSAGGLSISSQEALLKGGKSGPAIVLGDPDKSLLIEAVHQTGTLKMPKGSPKLSPEEIATLTEWIKMGAPWPKSTTPVRIVGKQITDDMRKFWSFQPLKMPTIP